MTVEIIKADKRHFSDFGWLKTYWLFSFSSYFDPRNIQLGALRVFNDDVVEPGMGFPTHPHEEMEIVTIVLDGEMTHEDSMGNKSVIRAGDVQRMSAGTGLTHSEFNLARKPVHFYQIWIFPDEAGLAPTYDQKTFSSKDQARIDTDEPLVLKADESAEFILIDVPSCKGWGYSAETLRGGKK